MTLLTEGTFSARVIYGAAAGHFPGAQNTLYYRFDGVGSANDPQQTVTEFAKAFRNGWADNLDQLLDLNVNSVRLEATYLLNGALWEHSESLNGGSHYGSSLAGGMSAKLIFNTIKRPGTRPGGIYWPHLNANQANAATGNIQSDFRNELVTGWEAMVQIAPPAGWPVGFRLNVRHQPKGESPRFEEVQSVGCRSRATYYDTRFQ